MRLVVFTFLLFSLSCASQTQISCYSNQANVFIKGYPNSVTINSNEKILEVTINNGTIEKINNNKYAVTTGEDSPVIIKVRTKNRTEEFYFSNREPALPILTFGGQVFEDNDAISAKRFRVARPDVLFPDLVCSDISLKFTEMTIIRIDKGNNLSREVVINEERSKLMSLAEPGDTYIFMDGKIVLELSSKTFQIPISKIKIKE